MIYIMSKEEILKVCNFLIIYLPWVSLFLEVIYIYCVCMVETGHLRNQQRLETQALCTTPECFPAITTHGSLDTHK